MLPIHKPILLICGLLLSSGLPMFAAAQDEYCPYCELIEGTGGTQIIIDKNLPNWQALLESALENILLGAIQPTIISVSPQSLPQGGTANLTLTASKDAFNPNAIQQVTIEGLQINTPEVAIPNARQLVVNVSVPTDTQVDTLRDIQVVTDGQTVVGTDLFYVTPAPTVAEILSATPNKVAKGSTTTVTLYGQGTAFDGSSQVDFGSGMTSTVTAHTPTSLTVELTVSDTAGTGYRHVTVTTNGVAVSNDKTKVGLLFVNATEIAGLPQVTQVTPTFGAQGQTLTLDLTGKDVDWSAGQTTLQLTGINVLSTTVLTPTSAQAQIQIPDDALLGSRDVYMTTNSGQTAVQFAGFAVVSPASLSLNRTSATQGTRQLLRIFGSNTHFKSGVTQVNFDKAGINVVSVNVLSATELEATIRVDADADTASSYFVTVVTGQEIAAFAGTFSVIAVGEDPTNQAPTGLTAAIIDPLPSDIAPNSVIATLSSEDPDTDDTHTYSLIAYGGDLFSINGNELITNGKLNPSGYSLLVRTTDAEGLWYQQAITLTVTAADPASPSPAPNPADPATTPTTPVDTTTPQLSFSAAEGIINGNELLITVDETSTPTTVYAARTGNQAVTVDIGFSGTAKAGEDYRLLTSSTLQWATNVTSPQPIVLHMLDDLATETTEQVVLTFSAIPAGVALGSPSVVKVQIRDNDAGDTDAQTPTKDKPSPDDNLDSTPVCEAAVIAPAEQAISLVAGDTTAVQWNGIITQLPRSDAVAEFDLNSLIVAGGLSQIDITGLQAGTTTLVFSNCASSATLSVAVTAPVIQPLTGTLAAYCALDNKTTDWCANPDAEQPLTHNAFALNHQGEALTVNATFAINAETDPALLSFMTPADSLSLNGFIKIDDAHYGKPALLFITLRHEHTGTQWSYAQGWYAWDGSPATLRHHNRVTNLPYLLPVNLELPLIDVLAAGFTGDYSWDLGYQLVSDGSLVFNNPWAFNNRFRVANSLSWSTAVDAPTTANTHFALVLNDEPTVQATLRMPALDTEIATLIQPDPAHIGQAADFFIVAAYFSADSAGAYKQLNDGAWVDWDGDPDSLLLERATLTQTNILRAELQIPVFSGHLQLAAGTLEVYVGYTLTAAPATIIYNQADALEIVLE